MRKTLMLLAVGFFVFIAEVRAAPVFNALAMDDPHYATYQVSLCQAVYADYRRMYSERYWLDQLDPKMASMSPDRREAWVEHYAITTALRDESLKDFEANCR
jgi:hypothetical protein